MKDGHPSPTNVIRLALSVAEQDGDIEQRVYYHPGVGTSRWDHWVGGAFGVGLSANVIDAYQFLVDNYVPGDDLYFFGFSRGAFTARSTAGLVRKCGILRRENRERIGEAYELYRSFADKPRGMTATLFRSAFSYTPDIRFIGVWDTVGALGIPPIGPAFLRWLIVRLDKRWSFHDTELSSHVRAAFQALAIDEQRSAFKPTLWNQSSDAKNQVLEQVWFSGVHCNVGGGLADSSLADLPLLWMVQKAQDHELVFAPGAFAPRTEGAEDDLQPGSSSAFTVAPNPLRLPDRSRVGLYRLARPWHRPIGLETGPDGGYGQRLAKSAIELRDANEQYRPPELEKYLQRPDRREPIDTPRTYTTDRRTFVPGRPEFAPSQVSPTS
jgi:uncharacterized protein (DUF2235 family)